MKIKSRSLVTGSLLRGLSIGILCLVLLQAYAFAEEPKAEANQAELTSEEIQACIERLAIASSAEGNDIFAIQYLIDHGHEPLVFEALLSALRDERTQVQLSAQYALFRMRDEPIERLDAILASLREGNEHARYSAQRLLLCLEPEQDAEYLPLLFEAYSSGDHYVRTTILRAVGGFYQEPSVLQIILDATEDEDASVRAKAVSSLYVALEDELFTGHHPEILPVVLNLLDDDIPNVRTKAVYALQCFGSRSESIDALREAIGDPHPDVRAAAIPAFAILAPQEEALRVVLEALHDPDDHVRYGALRAIRNMDAVPGAVIMELCELLKNQDRMISSICETLQRSGPNAREAVPTLIYLIEKQGSYDAMLALAAIGPDASPAIPLIGDLLYNGTSAQISAAIQALGGIGDEASDYYPRLLELAEDTSGRWRRQELAISALGSFMLARDEFIPELLDLLAKCEQDSLSIDVRLALYRLSYEPQSQLDIILAELYRDDSPFLYQAVWAVGEIGPSMSGVLPRLSEIQDNCYNMQAIMTLSEAIQKIEGTWSTVYQ